MSGRISSWKRLAVVSLFGGLGVAVGLAGTFAVWAWLASKPKPRGKWNEFALVAKGTPGFIATSDTIEFEFAVRNKTREDYSVEDSHRLRTFFRTQDDSALMPLSEDERVSTPLFIPAGETGSILLSISLADVPRQVAGVTDSAFHEELRSFLNRHASNVRGFVVYDDERRYKIPLPRWSAK
jgi:hypothetical protein